MSTSIGSLWVLTSSATAEAREPVLAAGTGSTLPFGTCGMSVLTAGMSVVVAMALETLVFGQGPDVDAGWLIRPGLGGPRWNQGLAGSSERAISRCLALISWSISPSIPCCFHSC